MMTNASQEETDMESVKYWKRCKWGVPFLSFVIGVGIFILVIVFKITFCIIFFGIMLAMSGATVLYYWYYDIKAACTGSLPPYYDTPHRNDNDTGSEYPQTHITYLEPSSNPPEHSRNYPEPSSSYPATLSVPNLPNDTPGINQPSKGNDKPPDYSKVSGPFKNTGHISNTNMKNSSLLASDSKKESSSCETLGATAFPSAPEYLGDDAQNQFPPSYSQAVEHTDPMEYTKETTKSYKGSDIQ